MGAAVYYQLSEAVGGIGDACRALGTPVSGGNVSLYNETPSGPVYPTPVIGMIGILESIEHRVPSAFREEGDVILLIGDTRDEIGASEYLAVVHGLIAGRPPEIDLGEAARLGEFLSEGAESRLFRSAHDCSDGGLAVALAEAAIGAEGGPRGISVSMDTGLPTASAFFGESQNRVVLSAPEDCVDPVTALAEEKGLSWLLLGHVGAVGSNWRVSVGHRTIDVAVDDLRNVFDRALPRRMENEAGLNS
jgi:phosphoribosylformylglycinamidine synthase